MDIQTIKTRLTWAKRLARLGILASLTVVAQSAVDAADTTRQATPNRQIDTSHARPVNRVQFQVAKQQDTQKPSPGRAVSKKASKTLLARAAHEEIIMESPPQFVPGSPIVEAACGFEPMCGAEVACGMEPSCGMGCDGPGMCGGCDACAGPMGCDAMPVWGGCDDPCGPRPYAAQCYPLLLPIFRINWSQFELFAGTQAFSGPPSFAGPANAPAGLGGNEAENRDGTASFGLMEGFNYSQPMQIFGGAFSGQLGLRATQTNASGAEFTEDNRKQLFFTGGIFRRVDYGLQGGVVFDYLYDDWYYNVGVAQIRGQLGWMMDPCNEFGYSFASSVRDDTGSGVIRFPGTPAALIQIAFEPLDQHRFFYRRHFKQTGFFEMFAGVTSDSDGLLGMSMEVPLIDGLGMRTGFTYLNPDIANGQADNQEETWNIGLGFVWYPCGTCARSKYDRPMFQVADNGSFLIDRR